MSSALNRLNHRGPDDRGCVITSANGGVLALGQTRLAIIDLSPGGHQPMESPDGRYLIVFNGEIYNYRELRNELMSIGYDFGSETDTEVLLAAWCEWGKSGLRRLEGMFAFAIHDRRSQRLTCVRDGFGIKPLYYDQGEHGILFASELSALKSLRATTPKPDLQRSYDYLVHAHYDFGNRSFVDGVCHLAPGTLIEVDLTSDKTPEPETWWRPAIHERATMRFDEAADFVRELFLHNIRLHLRSDVPLGAALSGGIDSSAIVCAVRHVEPEMPIRTFSYVAEGSGVSEEYWVDLVNDAVDATGHKVRATALDLAKDLDTVIAAQGEPFGSTSIYAQYRVFQLARENGVTVMLEGQGADELLAGYIGYPGQRMLSLLECGQLGAMHAFARDWAAWPGRSYSLAWQSLAHAAFPQQLHRRARQAMGRNFQPDWLDTNMLSEAGVLFRQARPERDPRFRGRRVVEQLDHSLRRHGLPHLLRQGDRNSMAHSIESRVPFLTLPNAEFLLSLPDEYLISPNGETKHIFRRAMRDIVPDAILDRRDKIGFATPEREWLFALAPMVREWLRDAHEVPFLHEAHLLKTFDEVISGYRVFSWQIWRWINYVRWYHHQEFRG